MGLSTRLVRTLPFSTAECDVGPIVECRPGQVEMRYDAEGHGEITWTVLRFEAWAAVRFTPDPACGAWMIAAYSNVREVDPSPWLAELRAATTDPTAALRPDLRHFFVYFDHVGCWEVLAIDVALVP